MMSEPALDSGIGRRITRYSALLTASGILCKILLLVYTVFAVQILGRERFGRIEYFIEMGIIFSVLVDFGLEQTITREIARRRQDVHQALSTLLAFRVVASLLGSLAMIGFLAAVRRPEHTWSLILCATTYFFVVFHMMLLRAILRSFELMPLEGLANLLDKLTHIGLAMLTLFLWPRLSALALCYTAGSLVSVAIYAVIILRRFGRPTFSGSFRDWIDWQKLATPIGLSAVCILLLHREDTAMVNWIRGDDETGLYRAPYRFLEGLFLFPQVMAISAYPIFSKLYHENRPFASTAADLLFGLLAISFPVAVGGTCIADEMMRQLTPELGAAGGTVFKILLWSLPFIYVNFLFGTILNAVDRQHRNFRASAWGLAGNALLNLPAIYMWGAYGASMVTVLSQALYGAIMLHSIKDFHILGQWKRYRAIGLACVVMAGVITWVPFRWYAAVPLGAVIYASVLLLFGAVTKKDLKNLSQVFSSNKS